MERHTQKYNPLADIWDQIVNFFFWLISLITETFQKAGSGPAITMDTGRQVRMGKKIAEGGFSFVFEATEDISSDHYKSNHGGSANHNQQRHYALKQIRCPEASMLDACRQEAAVHRAVMGHPNVLPLLGFAVQESVAYMLFPKMNRSLRAEINHRILEAPGDVFNVLRPPWNEIDVLNLFVGISRGLAALHKSHYSHRDVKVENVMFADSHSIRTPILMDFGSVGPLREEIQTRRQVLMLVEKAAQHTTMPYRPPELFDGGVRTGDPPVDFTKVDVWSLGCTFFACLYGASPFESEFARSNGRLRIVDCTQLKILGGAPIPPKDCPAASWYSDDILKLIEHMLTQEPKKRPTVGQVLTQLESIIEKKGGHVVALERTSELLADEDDADLDSLLNSNRNFAV